MERLETLFRKDDMKYDATDMPKELRDWYNKCRRAIDGSGEKFYQSQQDLVIQAEMSDMFEIHEVIFISKCEFRKLINDHKIITHSIYNAMPTAWKTDHNVPIDHAAIIRLYNETFYDIMYDGNEYIPKDEFYQLVFIDWDIDHAYEYNEISSNLKKMHRIPSNTDALRSLYGVTWSRFSKDRYEQLLLSWKL